MLVIDVVVVECDAAVVVSFVVLLCAFDVEGESGFDPHDLAPAFYASAADGFVLAVLVASAAAVGSTVIPEID